MAENGFVDVEGGRLYYETEGSGPPLTLIHAGVANLRQWDAQVPVLAERFRVIRYDTRGFGRTVTENISFSNRADLAALLDHLGATSTALLGTSRGGTIAIDFTLERPDRVSALIVVAGGLSGFDARPTPEEQAIFDAQERLSEAKEWDELIESETALWVDGPGQPPDRVPAAIRRQVHDWIAASYRDHGTEEPEPQPLDPPAAGRLGEIGAPALVVIGGLDESSTQASCRKVAAEVRGARLEVFEGVAHMVNLEQPERFTDLVLGFLGT